MGKLYYSFDQLCVHLNSKSLKKEKNDPLSIHKLEKYSAKSIVQKPICDYLKV